MSEFMHDIVDIGENGEIVALGKKCLYNLDDSSSIPLNKWIKENDVVEKIIFPEMKSGIALNGKECKIRKDFLGTLVSLGASIYSSAQGVALFSGCGRIGHSPMCPITPSNFLRCTCAFTARKLVENTWINQKDEYLAPDTMNPKYRQFEVDSIVYSLFHSSSQQSSLRNIDYKGKKWDIPNNFFWMSAKEIEALANENKLEEIYERARLAKDAYVHDLLKQVDSELSPEAKAVLEAATDLVRKSFKYRELFEMEKPGYQCGKCWDAGFFQLKQIWNAYMKADFDKFKELYRKLSGHLLPQVYELGFLKR